MPPEVSGKESSPVPWGSAGFYVLLGPFRAAMDKSFNAPVSGSDDASPPHSLHVTRAM